MAEKKLIVGLGNPGQKYQKTRHNAGFEVIDALAEKLAVTVKQKKFGSYMGQADVGIYKLILLKPQMFMNNSGQAIATAAGFYKLEKEDVMVIFDDMWIDAGAIRIRPDGSAGGHNGVKDTIEKLGTKQFARLRVGIGQSEYQNDYDYVLSRPTKEQRLLIDEAIEKAVEAVLMWIEKDGELNDVMAKFN